MAFYSLNLSLFLNFFNKEYVEAIQLYLIIKQF
jgi:hypothetical protein